MPYTLRRQDEPSGRSPDSSGRQLEIAKPMVGEDNNRPEQTQTAQATAEKEDNRARQGEMEAVEPAGSLSVWRITHGQLGVKTRKRCWTLLPRWKSSEMNVKQS